MSSGRPCRAAPRGKRETVPPASPLQHQLQRELSGDHPLTAMAPDIIGRCRACDDVVAALAHTAGEPELAVVHLTWLNASERPAPQRAAWPCFERLTTPEFVERYLRGGAHL